SQCFQIQLETEATAVGLTLIGEGRNHNYRTYRFNNSKKCKRKHEQEISIGNVRKNNFKCKQCVQIKLETEAKAVGLTLIGEGRRKGHRTYRFNYSKKCKRKHEQEIDTSAVRTNNFKCNQCLQIKLEKEAKAVGLTLIGKGRNKNYRTYRFNKCKHEQEIDKGAVRTNYFKCNTCEETSRDLPSKVYLLKIQSGSFIWLKLGYAKTVKTRMKQYRLPEDAKVMRLKVIDFDTGREAHRYESSLHKKYIRKRLPIKKMKEFHKTGFNECYPLEMLDKLLEELEYK
ncbi:MAG: GIY-YIG nuclease family protein, partial [Gammaproteobacteria bacterium]|nr:GIY-YIG nuclease family protein [Gammaproteobacteria bacterium]